MRRPVLSLVLVSLLSLGLSAGGSALGQTTGQVAKGHPKVPAKALTAAATTTNHFITNLHGDVAGPRRVGFNVFDTGASLAAVQALPSGVRGLVWLGEKCPTPATAAFRSTVRALSTSPKVFGYYLSDEPHVADCPQGPKALASRTAYIKKLTHGAQRSFIVLSKSEDYRAFRTQVTGVDLVGLDPYPCSIAHPTCDPTKIDEKVDLAVSSDIHRWRIVPVYQAFGQTAAESLYYTQPSASQMRTMLERWTTLLPHPQMDYTYGWGHQSSANPTLTDSAALQGVFADYFAR